MAYPEMKRLKQIAENRFRNNDPALTQLGLKSRRTAATAATTTSETADGRDETAVIDQDAAAMETNGSQTNSTETSTTRKYKTQSKSLGAYLARWRMLYTNISTLTEAEQGQLTKAKWTPERIDQAAALVEATAEADTAQKIHEHAYQVQCDRVRAQLANLRDWYRDLLGLLKPALDGIEDMEKARYKTLFDL
jgi:hypothetical protein